MIYLIIAPSFVSCLDRPRALNQSIRPRGPRKPARALHAGSSEQRGVASRGSAEPNDEAENGHGTARGVVRTMPGRPWPRLCDCNPGTSLRLRHSPSITGRLRACVQGPFEGVPGACGDSNPHLARPHPHASAHSRGPQSPAPAPHLARTGPRRFGRARYAQPAVGQRNLLPLRYLKGPSAGVYTWRGRSRLTLAAQSPNSARVLKRTSAACA